MRVIGTVIDDETGRPLEGLRVRAFDKDLVFDDRLGEVATDAEGRFEIVYSESMYRDFQETEPDIYIRIYDPSGERLLYSTEDAVRWNSLAVERFEVRIPRSAHG
jgi:hypothetical protein